VSEAADGREALASFAREEPDLVLTDLAMPVSDGFDVVSGVRRAGPTPVLVLSVRGADGDKIRALDLGADDYVTKPFSLPELLARVRAHLRRSGAGAGPRVLRFEGLAIDLERRRVQQGEREVKLTPTELSILELLATNAGKPVTTARIIARVWKGAPGTTVDVVRVHVGTMRRKLEPDPSSPRYVVTEPWVGYRFVAEPLPD
jgi:Response regulators consisting of a CheY-like receiver domain and a winged-helix DNA-binding domain